MKVPKKNIFKKMMDVRAPQVLRAGESIRGEGAKHFSEKEIFAPKGISKPDLRTKIPWKSIFLSLLVFAVFGGGFWLFSAYQSKQAFFKQAGKDIADSGLSAGLGLPGGSFEIKNFSDIETKLWPLLKGGVGAYKGLMGGISAWMKLGQDAVALKANISGFLSGGEGDILTPLRGISEDVAALNSAVESIDMSGSDLTAAVNISPQEYLNLKLELSSWRNALNSLVGWLSSDRKIIVFLQNTSEMRPTGGFWGSYAEINVQGGKLADIEMRDINEVDRTLELKTVPPKPLQALVTNWRTADSNWFFNFPDSASKAAEFMDSSKLYGDDGSRVDLIAVVSPEVIADIFRTTGPVNVSSTKAAIDENNFLSEIQSEVQAGQDVGSSDAKNILDEIFAALIPKLVALGADSEQEMLNAIVSRVESKDIMLWAGDEEMEAIFKDKQADGSVFQVPQRFEGDYLSVVIANVGGGKSDYVMSQKIALESQISSDGVVSNHLEILRKNNAKSTDKWWYRVANQSYVRVFLSSLGKLSGAKGGIQKTVKAPINYKTAGYYVDPLVEAIESTAAPAENFSWLTTFSEAGKTVLAAWQKTARGETSKLSYDYSHRLFLSPAEGVVYQFVMDKQAGVNSEYNFSFAAPVGFVWKESGSPVFEYKNTDIPARLVISLTLQKEI
ncbi:MAG: Uncharacterized protein LiPW15_658 [Parcubacteria group bacterium LiPW_15]|nr:MAG: Uncharacterized protein LiPW15_658 [Parcubacteria group bacterium LiPW_15]